MASDPELELRVSRLENDTSSIYDLITEIRSTQQDHSRRFEAIDRRLAAMDTRFDGMDARFDGMDARFGDIEVTLAEVLRRLPEPS